MSGLIVGEVSSPPDLTAALLALIISALMIVGVFFYGLNYASLTNREEARDAG